MSQQFKDRAFTDTKNHVYWSIPLGAIVLGLAAASFYQGVSTTLGVILLVAGLWQLAVAYLHLSNGKTAVMTLKQKGIQLPDKVFVPYKDIEDIWAGDPFPMLPHGRLNLVFKLNKDAKITQTKRSAPLQFKMFFSLTTVGNNISMIGKKKSVSLMAPGLRPLDGSKQNEESILEEIYARMEADDLQNEASHV
jgi:hypothetical protein